MGAALSWVRDCARQRKKRVEARKRQRLELEMEDRIRTFPDRVVMTNSILPGVGKIARDILWIGCRGYTRDYHLLLERHGAKCWTIDIDPEAAKFGHPIRHVTADLTCLEDHFLSGAFDAILCNGVFGWGINSIEAQSKALGTMARLLRPAGSFVLGWNTNRMPDPATLLLPGFEPDDLFGLGKRMKFSGSTHVYDFCRRKSERADAIA